MVAILVLIRNWLCTCSHEALRTLVMCIPSSQSVTSFPSRRRHVSSSKSILSLIRVVLEVRAWRSGPIWIDGCARMIRGHCRKAISWGMTSSRGPIQGNNQTSNLITMLSIPFCFQGTGHVGLPRTLLAPRDHQASRKPLPPVAVRL